MLGLMQNPDFRKSPTFDIWFVSGQWRGTKMTFFYNRERGD